MVPDTVLRLSALRVSSDVMAGSLPGDWHFWTMPPLAAVLFAALSCLIAMLTFRRGPCSRDVAEPRHGLFRLLTRRIVWARKPVSDQPLLWRELYCRRATIIEKVVWSIFILAGAVVLTLIIVEWPSSVVALNRGPATGPPPLVSIIGGGATFCYLSFLAFPFLALSGATGLADERDGSIYELLQLTDLRHSEFLHAKISRLATLVAVLVSPPLLLSGIMVTIGYSRWWALLLVGMTCIASFSFATLLGLTIALRSRSTNHAVAMTFVSGVIGGFLTPLFVALSVKNAPTFIHYAFATISPPLQCFFLMMFDTVHGEFVPAEIIARGTMRAVALFWSLLYGLSSLGLYTIARCSSFRSNER